MGYGNDNNNCMNNYFIFLLYILICTTYDNDKDALLA